MAETAPTESVLSEVSPSAPTNESTPADSPQAPTTPVEASPTTATQSQPESTQPTADFSLAELERLRGENASLQSEVDNYRPLATLGNQFLHEQMHGTPQAQPQQPQPGQPEQEKPWWDGSYTPVEYNKVWDAFVGEDGSFNNNTPPQVQEAYLKYNNQLRENLHQLGQNPAKFLEPMINEAVRRAEEKARDVYGEQYQQQQDNQFVQGLEQQNADWLYARNQDGSYVNDGRGQRVPSNLGQRANQLIQQVGAPVQQGGWGIESPQARWQAAMTLLQQEVQSQMAYPQQQAAQAQPTTQVDEAEQKRQELLDSRRKQASKTKGTNGTRETASQTAPTNRIKPDFRQAFRDQLEVDGLLGTSFD